MSSKDRRIGTPELRRWLSFLAGCAVVVFLWTVVLPAAGRLHVVRRHVERNRALGIHPDAMFYTEIGPVDGVQLIYIDGQPTGRSIRMGE